MNMWNRKVSRCSLRAAVVGAGMILGAGATAWGANWVENPSPTPANSDWNAAANWSPASVPDNTTNIYVSTNNNGTSSLALSGTETAAYLQVINGNTASFTLASSTTLTLPASSGGMLLVYTQDSYDASHATFTGPASGPAATITLGRWRAFSTPSTSGQQNSIVFSGPNLNVISNDPNNYNEVGDASNVTITGGASVLATGGGAVGGRYYIRDSAAGRLTVDNGSLAGAQVHVGATSGTLGGTLQLGASGTIAAGGLDAGSNPVTAMTITVNDTARFEAEGTGLNGNVTPTILSNGVLAVGVTPAGGSRTAAATFTLNGAMNINSGGILEMGLFGSHSNDQIDLSAGGLLTNANSGAGTLLKLVTPSGYTPVAGDSWTMFTGTTSGVSGIFDLSQLGPQYDTSNFNQVGGWKISVVPEPASLGLLAAGGLLLLRRRTH